LVQSFDHHVFHLQFYFHSCRNPSRIAMNGMNRCCEFSFNSNNFDNEIENWYISNAFIHKIGSVSIEFDINFMRFMMIQQI
jgi:hypothetical protein